MINGDYILVDAPKNYSGKKYRDKYCYEHHLVYWETYGILPKEDEVIHHKDGNKHNNSPSNLELLKRKNHSHLHEKYRLINYVLLKCVGCNELFIKEKRRSYLIRGGRYTCCSRKCIGYSTNLPVEEKEKRISENLIFEFQDYKIDL